MVRAETIIKGGDTSIELYCGACNFTWKELPPSPTSAPTAPGDPHHE
jgi:hypothetical protein